jgi:hypothetical protein
MPSIFWALTIMLRRRRQNDNCRQPTGEFQQPKRP